MSGQKRQTVILSLILIGALAITAVAAFSEKRGGTFQRQELNAKEPFAFIAAPSQPRFGEIVYLSPSGNKYHLYSDCTALASARERIGVLLETAVLQNKEECRTCRRRYQTEARTGS